LRNTRPYTRFSRTSRTGRSTLPLFLRPVRAARARREAPMLRKAQKLEIVDGRPTLQAEVLRDHRLHLIEEQLRRYAAEHQERVLEPGEQRPHVLARREATPQQPRVPEHDQQRVAFPHGKRNSAKSTWAWRPAGVSKRTAGSGAGVGGAAAPALEL
jgi:hypothetical protein